MADQYAPNTEMSFSAGQLTASLCKHTGGARVTLHSNETTEIKIRRFPKTEGNHREFVTLDVIAGKEPYKQVSVTFLSLEQLREIVEKGQAILALESGNHEV